MSDEELKNIARLSFSLTSEVPDSTMSSDHASQTIRTHINSVVFNAVLAEGIERERLQIDKYPIIFHPKWFWFGPRIARVKVTLSITKKSESTDVFERIGRRIIESPLLKT